MGSLNHKRILPIIIFNNCLFGVLQGIPGNPGESGLKGDKVI